MTSRSRDIRTKYSTLVHQDDRLVGVCLCSVHNYNNDVEADSSYPDPEQYDFAEDIAQGPYTQHKANQLVTFVATLERRQRELLHHANKVMKIDVICVSEKRGSWIREGPSANFYRNGHSWRLRLGGNRCNCGSIASLVLTDGIPVSLRDTVCKFSRERQSGLPKPPRRVHEWKIHGTSTKAGLRLCISQETRCRCE